MPRRAIAVLLHVPAAILCQPDIRVNVDLAQIEAVVTDSKGRHVPGLGVEDFVLKVDGKERRISYLAYVGDSLAPAAPLNGALRRDDVPQTIVFMVDETHTSPENFGQLVINAHPTTTGPN